MKGFTHLMCALVIEGMAVGAIAWIAFQMNSSAQPVPPAAPTVQQDSAEFVTQTLDRSAAMFGEFASSWTRRSDEGPSNFP